MMDPRDPKLFEGTSTEELVSLDGAPKEAPPAADGEAQEPLVGHRNPDGTITFEPEPPVTDGTLPEATPGN